MSCRANTNGELCDCELYDPPLELSAPSRCKECARGKSKHTLAPFPQAGTKHTVLDIFAAQSEKPVKRSLPTAAHIADFSTARADALKGYRPTAAESTTKPKKKGRSELRTSASKQTAVRVALLTCGIKNGELRGSSKALTGVDLVVRGQHGCAVKGVVLDETWSADQCIKHFTTLFPRAFEYAYARHINGPLYTVVAKEYQTLRVVPTSTGPTGEDLIDYKVKDKKRGAIIYIALMKAIPDDTYASWYTGPPKEQPSSEVDSYGEDGAVKSEVELNSSDDEYDPVKDSDVKEMEDVHVSGRYQTRVDSSPSTRKRDSMAMTFDNSDVEFVPTKKQRVSTGKSLTTQNATPSGSSSRTHGNVPLFFPDSESELDGSSYCLPSQSASTLTVPKRPIVKRYYRQSPNPECHCLRVSPPPTVVIPKLESWDTEPYHPRALTRVNPWNAGYKPPQC
ncbi:hypothetical protein B0H19DRAFT_1256510 [Mycena capillaripes]|nr:hypothetical protein B0H19DRAFT_1256510 [Mycena capillaripes]